MRGYNPGAVGIRGRAACSVCERVMHVNADGNMGKHGGTPANRCPGSGRPPAESIVCPECGHSTRHEGRCINPLCVPEGADDADDD